MGRSVGVDLRETSIRLLSLERSGKNVKILQFHEEPLPAGETSWEERAAQALRNAFMISKIPRNQVIACLDSGDAILREVSLPFKNEEQIRKTVRFEMESLIHNYTIEQLIVAYYKREETERGSLLLAAAVPRLVVEKRLKVFQDAGADPAALDLDVCAMFNALRNGGAVDTDEPHLLIHGTAKFTKLVFVEQRKPRSIRTLRFAMPSSAHSEAPPPPVAAGDDLTPVVVLDTADATRFQDLDTAAQKGLMELLAKEISRFLLANAASATPSHILLTGDLEDPCAARLLEEASHIPVVTFDLLERLEHPFGENTAGMSAKIGVPLGLALKGADVDAMEIDFRQAEYAYEKKFEAVKTSLLVTIELAVVFLAAVALHLYFKRSDWEVAQSKVLGAHRTLYEDASGEKLEDASAAYVKIKELHDGYERSLGKGLPLERSARDIWRDLFRALQTFQAKYGNQSLGDGSLYVELDSFEIRQNTTSGNESCEVLLRGKIQNLQFAGALRDEVRTVESFKTADYVGDMKPVEDGLFAFALRIYRGRREN